MGAKFEFGYVLDVEGPLRTIEGRYMYKDKKTGEFRTGWYHCGCCGQDGFMSTNTPTCTGCANKLQFGKDDHSPVSVQHINDYIDWFNRIT
jgi:hypothetical protein